MEDKDKIDVALDFDGVIHGYNSGFLGYDNIPDPPNMGAIEYIEMLHKNEIKFAIMSSRATEDGIVAIKKWLINNGLSKDIVDSIKITREKIHANLYIDDRAFHFKGHFPTVEYIKQFKPWYK